jgi:hypothetical protein
MGATVFTDHAVRVVNTPKGMGFILYEMAYEKNCYPHTPHWGCIGVGRRKDVIKTLLRFAAGCEGGGLQGRSGAVKPESYLKRWIKALKVARVIDPYDIKVSSKMAPMLWDGDPKLPPLAEDRACPLTDAQKADWDAGKEVVLNLECDFAAISWLVNHGRLSSWRTMDGGPDAGGPEFDISGEVFLPKDIKKKVEVFTPVPTFYKLFKQEDNLLTRRDEGVFASQGWAYSVIGSFIASYWEKEVADPGWWADMFSAYRDAVDRAQVLPAETVIVPVAGDWLTAYQKKEAEKMIAEHPRGIRLGDYAVRNSEMYRVASVPAFRVKEKEVSLERKVTVGPWNSSRYGHDGTAGPDFEVSIQDRLDKTGQLSVDVSPAGGHIDDTLSVIIEVGYHPLSDSPVQVVHVYRGDTLVSSVYADGLDGALIQTLRDDNVTHEMI